LDIKKPTIDKPTVKGDLVVKVSVLDVDKNKINVIRPSKSQK
jgi:hypothetical protein